MDGILIVASWVEQLTKELGLTNVSQIWSDRPGWYLWFKEAPGVYALELAEVERLDPDDPEAMRGRFVLKLYPDPGDPHFGCFSALERELVLGPWFDHLHTPAIEAQHRIAPHLFQIGLLEVTTTEDKDWCLISLAALDRRSVRQADNDDCLCSVPAWSLAFGLLRPLLGLYAFSSKQRPARIALNREPGFMGMHHADGSVTTEPDPASRLNSLSLLFCPNPARIPPAASQRMAHALAEDPLGMAFDLAFDCGHLHRDHLDEEQIAFLDEAWWKYAGVDYKSHLSSSCGCEH